jgi:hypothetical protein
MHDPLIRRLASNGKVKSAATRGPGFSWPGSAPQAGVFSGFQYLTPPLHLLPSPHDRARQVINERFTRMSTDRGSLTLNTVTALCHRSPRRPGRGADRR